MSALLTQWASYQIRNIAGCACTGNAGNVFPRHQFQRKPLVSDPGMHHGTCVTHVSWCMSGSLTCGDGENVPGIPGACAPATLRIWQEADRVISLVPSRCYDWLTLIPKDLKYLITTWQKRLHWVAFVADSSHNIVYVTYIVYEQCKPHVLNISISLHTFITRAVFKCV